MKRSQMIRLLASYIYELNVDPEESDELASKILKGIEEAGMLPPYTKHPDIPKDMSMVKWASEKALESTYNYENLPNNFEINEWEPEDEEV